MKRLSKLQSIAVSAVRNLQQFAKIMLLVFGMGLMAAFLSSIHSHPASAASAGPAVTVANTPLPVTGNVNATVSGTVGISGTPNVSAAQSGSWTVGISGTPTVNLGNTGPLSVTATGDPALSTFTPLSVNAANGSFANGFCRGTIINPATSGQILVIENVGAQISMLTGQKVLTLSIQGGPYGLFLWSPSYQADDGTAAYFGASQAMRFYFPAGDNILMEAIGNNLSANGVCNFNVSGYTVNVH